MTDKTYTTIEQVLSDFVNALRTDTRNWEIDFEGYGKACVDALKRLYQGSDETPHIRLSAIGKPVVLQMLPVLGYNDKGPFDCGLRDIFFTGCEWEERTLAKLAVFHPQVRLDRQVEVSFMGVTGHLDCVMHVEGVGSCILELKTTHSFGAGKVDKYGMDDDKGYLTQLTLYCEALGLRGFWLVHDKGKGETNIYELERDAPETQLALGRATRIIPMMLKVKTLDDLFTSFRPPSPEIASIKSGNFMTIPPTMKYCPHLDAIYEMVPHKGSTRPEVIRVYSKEEIIDNINRKYLL